MDMNNRKPVLDKDWEFVQKCQSFEDLLCVGSSDEQIFSNTKNNKTKDSRDPEFIAKVLLKKMQRAEAAQKLTEAISSNPTKSSLHSCRAIALLKLGHFKSAEEECSRALDMKKTSFKAYLRRALARKYQGKFIEACQDCWKIFEMHPALETEASIIRKEYDDMVKCAIDELIGIIIGDVHQKYNSEHVGQLRNEFSAKEKYFGNKLLLDRKFEEAIVKYTNAIRMVSKDPTFYGNRALCWMELGKYKEAEEDCTKALKLDDTYLKVLIRRARVRRAQGNMLGARDDYMSAVALKQGDDPIIEELQELNNDLKKDPLLLKNLKAREERKSNNIYGRVAERGFLGKVTK